MNDPSNRTPGGPPARMPLSIKRLALGAVLVAAMVGAFFWLTPQLSQDYTSPVAGPNPTDTPAPSATPSQTPIALPSATAAVQLGPTPTFYPVFDAGTLGSMDLDPKVLDVWTGTQWSLADTSNQFDTISLDLRLLASLQDMNPRSSRMQVFVPRSGACAQPFCQIAWLGIVFDSPQDTYRALTLLNMGENGALAPPFKLDNTSQAYPAPLASALPNGAAPKGSISSFDFHRNNLFARISILSPAQPDLADVEKSIALVNEIFAEWSRKWGAAAPTP